MYFPNAGPVPAFVVELPRIAERSPVSILRRLQRMNAQ